MSGISIEGDSKQGGTMSPSGPGRDESFSGLLLLIPLFVFIPVAILTITRISIISSSTAIFALNFGVVVLGALGFSHLYKDSANLAQRESGWRPNPWVYLLGGSVLMFGYLYYWIQPSPIATVQNGTAIAGMYLLALCMSSVVSGPLYLLNRQRHLS